MAFTIVCPPGHKNMFTGEPARSYNNSYVCFPYGNTGSTIEIPPTNELHLAMKCSIADKDSRIIIIHSQNHKITIKPTASKGPFAIFQDDEKIVDEVSYMNNLYGDKVSVSLKNEGSNYLTLKVNGKMAAEYKEALLDGEPVTSIEFFDPWSDYGNFKIYWLIISSAKIPNSATVKTIYPKVETDWEEGTRGAYQTSEVGKTMKLLLPDDAATEGKAILSAISFLSDVVGGGDVNAVSVHTDGIDKDQTADLCENPVSIGTYFAGTSTFTTKE